MDENITKPGQTVQPTNQKSAPDKGEVAVSIDHNSTTSKPTAQAPAPSSAAKAPEPPVTPQAVVATSPAPAQVTKPAEPAPTVTEASEQTEQIATTQEANNDQTNEALIEDRQPGDSFEFVNDDEPTDLPEDSYEWTASEFIAHEKTAGWYVGLIIVAAIISAIVYFITGDKISVGVVLFGAIFFAVFASHKPREMNYSIGPGGIDVGKKHYDFEEFKSFGVVPEGAFSSIVFMPHRRFAIPLNIYYPPDDETKIANLIGSYLPIEEHSKDAVDKLLRSIRFWD